MAAQLSAVSSERLASSFLPKAGLAPAGPVAAAAPRASLPAVCADATSASGEIVSRRSLSLAAAAAAVLLASPLPAKADFETDYQSETTEVIAKVRATLSLDRDDPNRGDAVNELRNFSNDWVAKYRREKGIAGRPSFSNMYSVLNAISGHYISFGPTYPIPKKRQDRILEECDIAEKALARGR